MDESIESKRIMKTAYLFPGQGAQIVGMGQDVAQSVASAAALYTRANDILSYDLQSLCFSGPEEKLNSTVHSQPAIFVTSAALLAALREQTGDSMAQPDVVAGLSMGEYTALYAAGLLDFEQALRLVARRGQAMQEAAEQSDGGMVSIIGLDDDKVQQLCTDAAHGELLQPANFNCPGQIVISGARAACERAAQIAADYGAMKAIPLAVAGAFHTPLMQPAATALRQALVETKFSPPGRVSVMANVDATYYDSTDAIVDGLTRQLVAPILWQRCMQRLLDEGVECFYEIGPGRVLTGLMRRIHRKTQIVNISSLDALGALA